jgi:hypothetical protein
MPQDRQANRFRLSIADYNQLPSRGYDKHYTSRTPGIESRETEQAGLNCACAGMLHTIVDENRNVGFPRGTYILKTAEDA